MGIIGDTPTYPVVDRAPTMAASVANFNMTDLRDMAVFTAASLPVGYMAGSMSAASIRRPAMVTSGIIGGLAGLMWGIQSSSGRLMGFFENTEEVKRMR